VARGLPMAQYASVDSHSLTLAMSSRALSSDSSYAPSVRIMCMSENVSHERGLR